MELTTLYQSVKVSELPETCARFGVQVVGRTRNGAVLSFDEIHLAPAEGQTPEQAAAWARFAKTGERV